MSVEEELRAAFARHEAATPAADQLRDKIKTAVVRRKRRRVIASAAVAVLAVGTALPVALSDLHSNVETSVNTLAGIEPSIPADGLNVLLIGTDRGLGSTGARADAVMIVHVTADLGHAYLVSLPRSGQVAGGSTLGEAYRAGGAPLIRRAITGLTGLDFDATVTVDPATLSAVTDAVGGVEVCLDRAVSKRYPAGCQQLDGADVVQLLRARYGLANGIYDRDRNGQRFLRALAGKVTSEGALTNPEALNALLAVADRHGLTIDGDIGYLLRAAASIRAAAVVGIGAPSYAAADSSHERIYPQVGPSLYDALRRDDLASWVAAHPSYVLK